MTGSGKPSNTDAYQLDLNNGGWILIAILICIIVILVAVVFFIHFKNSKTISKLQEFSKKEVNDEERDLLIRYRKLDSRDKTVINNTLSTLSENHENDIFTKG